MYKIEYLNGTVEYVDDAICIKKHTNGCYVPCLLEQAQGICLKKKTNSEEYLDIPYILEAYANDNEEKIAYFKEVSLKEEVEELNEIINILVGGIVL